MVHEGEGKRWPRRWVLLVLAAVGVGGIWLVMHSVRAARLERLGEDIVVLASGSPPPATIEKLRAAGPHASFEALTAVMDDMVDKPPREWAFSPQDALKALIRLHGAESVKAATAFLPALKDGRPKMRTWALYAISRCCRKRSGAGPAPSDVLPAIVEALGDEDARVRDEACDCFVAVHSDWQRGLISCLQHSEPLVRCAAIKALGRRGGSRDRVGRFPEAVLPMLDDSDSRVRAQAAVSLAKLGRGSDRVLELLRGAIRGDDQDLRAPACSAVGDMGAAASAAVPDLLACLDDDDAVIRRCAASSLADIAPTTVTASEKACAILIHAVEEGGMPAVFAARSLGELGPAAPASAISVLERAATSNHAFVKSEAKRALVKIRRKKD